MNLQEIFNKVVLHLNKQGVKSVNEDGRCMYRGDNGTMCAVGCLIHDNVYLNEHNPRIEGLPVTYNQVQEHLRLSGISCDKETIELLHELQQLHDDRLTCSFTSPRFLSKVKYIASEFDLSVPANIVIND